MQLNESKIAEVLGHDGLNALVTAFYARVKTDDIIGPMYPDNDWAGAEDRLAGFLRFRFAGDQSYIQDRGHPRLRMRHMPFPIGQAAAERWIALMQQAMADTNVPANIQAILDPFFTQTAFFMMNQATAPAPGSQGTQPQG